MSLKFDSIEDADQSLTVMKNQDELIKLIFEIYKNKYPKYNKDTICKMIAEKSGKSRSTIWELISRTGGDSVYEKKSIKFI
jgi:hypothetical protein